MQPLASIGGKIYPEDKPTTTGRSSEGVSMIRCGKCGASGAYLTFAGFLCQLCWREKSQKVIA